MSGPLEARAHVAVVVEELRAKDDRYGSGWTLTAADAAGQVLFAVDLDSNVRSRGAWLLSLLLLQGPELREYLVHVPPDILDGVAHLV